MRLPSELFEKSISVRQIFYFQSTKLNTSVPHYFICLSAEDEGMVLLSCCTSQFEKRKSFIESRGLPYSTLVWIKPDKYNGLTIQTYVDCNSYFDYTKKELLQLYEDGKLEHKGEVSEIHFEQILIGLRDSPLIEEAIKEKLIGHNRF